MALGIGLLCGPREGSFLMSEVPLYPLSGHGVKVDPNEVLGRS